jgi:glycosyltransferase involved in cell wall biosynthesis
MRILLVNDYLYPFGGAEEVFFNTKELLVQKGHEVEVLGATTKNFLPPILNGWFSLYYYINAKSLIKTFRPDIVHIHGCIRRISPSPLIAIKKYKVPIVMTVHDYDLLGPEITMIHKRLQTIRRIKLFFQKSIITKYIDLFLCPSRSLQTLLSEKFNHKKCIYLPNFIRVPHSNSQVSKGINTKQFLFVGRLSKEKGLVTALEALYLAMHAGNIRDMQFTIIGEGKELPSLLQLTETLGLQNNVRFLGNIPNTKLSRYFQESIAVIIPSVYMENSPLVAYEAMYNKKPIIATYVGGLPDLVRHKKTGYLFEMGNKKELAYYMRQLYNNPSLSNTMGKLGFQKITREFNKELYYKNLITIYRKFVS